MELTTEFSFILHKFFSNDDSKLIDHALQLIKANLASMAAISLEHVISYPSSLIHSVNFHFGSNCPVLEWSRKAINHSRTSQPILENTVGWTKRLIYGQLYRASSSFVKIWMESIITRKYGAAFSPRIYSSVDSYWRCYRKLAESGARCCGSLRGSFIVVSIHLEVVIIHQVWGENPWAFGVPFKQSRKETWEEIVGMQPGSGFNWKRLNVHTNWSYARRLGTNEFTE